MGVDLTEEPYDGPVATALVRALLDDLNVRYGEIALTEVPVNQQEGDEAYLAEVTVGQVSRPTGSFVVAWVDGEAAGCGALRESPDFPGEGEIKRMYVSPAVRGRGVGRAVLRHLEALALELGYARLRLETGTAQPEAIALYGSSGWHPIESYGRYAGHPASVCLGKDL